MCSNANFVGSQHDVWSILRDCSACSNNCRGKLQLVAHNTSIKCFLKVWIAHSIAFTQWLCGSTNCTPICFNFKNSLKALMPCCPWYWILEQSPSFQGIQLMCWRLAQLICLLYHIMYNRTFYACQTSLISQDLSADATASWNMSAVSKLSIAFFTEAALEQYKMWGGGFMFLPWSLLSL